MEDEVDQVIPEDIQLMEMVIHGECNRGQRPVGACVRLNALKKKGDVPEISDIGILDDAPEIIKDKCMREGTPVKGKSGQNDDGKSHMVKFNLFSHPEDSLPDEISLNPSPVFSITRLPELGFYFFPINGT